MLPIPAENLHTHKYEIMPPKIISSQQSFLVSQFDSRVVKEEKCFPSQLPPLKTLMYVGLRMNMHTFPTFNFNCHMVLFICQPITCLTGNTQGCPRQCLQLLKTLSGAALCVSREKATVHHLEQQRWKLEFSTLYKRWTPLNFLPCTWHFAWRNSLCLVRPPYFYYTLLHCLLC